MELEKGDEVELLHWLHPYHKGEILKYIGEYKYIKNWYAFQKENETDIIGIRSNKLNLYIKKLSCSNIERDDFRWNGAIWEYIGPDYL